MTKKRADHTLMRNINRSLILRHLRLDPGLSRADLAGRTGLMRSTISSLVDELLENQLVHETGIAPSRGGRRGTLLELNPAGGCAVGVEITSHAVRVLLTDFIAQPRWEHTYDITNTDPDIVLPQTEALIEGALQFNADHDNMLPLGIGLGIVGLVDTQHGILRAAANLDWQDIPFQALWMEHFDLPVHVGNEASIAAQGEYYFGAAQGYTDFIYLNISRLAIGAGMFINGQLYQGMGGYAGEVGHMVIDPAGAPCACGKNGCWEMQLRAAIGRETLANGEQVSAVLALGIANLINAFNPQLVVIGGPLGLELAAQVDTIAALVAEQVIIPDDNIATITASQMADNACALGAVALVLDDVLHQPTW